MGSNLKLVFWRVGAGLGGFVVLWLWVAVLRNG